ncbi:GNAT family N-acetyltransferase [Rhodobacteraceae bacterium B1Z28]|uniref:GNAT family N-acetyltransferase n=1 Tax=Ruegeria haliotis TaxID=2747601 RepID=A0ABX2PTM6_9RHOB|nr:GNAT family N-acetyltransferase [Ruegeria haliotis]NVO57523.1 GNAT family N-acetyltransferase [Ruegeria haliotis]
MTPARCTQPPSGKAAMAAAQYRAALPVIQTRRLVLRAPTLDDLPVWTSICQDSFGDTAQEAWTEFSYYTSGWLLHGHGLFTVTLREDDQVIGFVILGLEWDDQEPELGYMFSTEHRMQGYATEACTAVRDFGFDLLGSGQFVSYVSASNARSNALAARLGAARDKAVEHSFGPDQHVWRYGEVQA